MEYAVQWEYHLLQIRPRFVGGADLDRLTDQMADLGRQGWELVGQVPGIGGQEYVFFFKRPLGPLRESHKDADN